MDFETRKGPPANFVLHNYSFNSTQASSHSLLDIAHRLIDAASLNSFTWVNLHINYSLPSPPSDRQAKPPPRAIANWGAQLYDQDYRFSLADLEDFVTTDLGTIFEARSKQTLLLDNGLLHTVIPLPYARYAWLIPVRGNFYWEKCTGAVVLDSSCGYNAGLDLQETIEKHIVWTHASLQSFWAFLLEIKETGAAGGIGLSFHVTRGPSIMSQSVQTLPKNLSPQTLPYTNIDVASNSQSIHSAASPRGVLSSVDHIKIYHEGSMSMHLRNILHMWSFSFPGGSEQLPKKKRILKGSKLALVDERSTGILLS
ncbi:hypothetical protein H0H92_008815 [Tricholoma furcatifolium]|nr:hypothetical protein H0H92_008815 [Tricholoma furcatifolium]